MQRRASREAFREMAALPAHDGDVESEGAPLGGGAAAGG